MKEAFETMGNHPLLTVFLGILLIFVLAAIADIITAFRKD